jgi:hypothetical protein
MAEKAAKAKAALKRKYSEAFDFAAIANITNMAATRWEGDELSTFLSNLGRAAAVIQEAAQDNDETQAAYGSLKEMLLRVATARPMAGSLADPPPAGPCPAPVLAGAPASSVIAGQAGGAGVVRQAELQQAVPASSAAEVSGKTPGLNAVDWESVWRQAHYRDFATELSKVLHDDNGLAGALAHFVFDTRVISNKRRDYLRISCLTRGSFQTSDGII